MTVADVFAREQTRDGSRPLLTWYDDATGERAELSVATAANWAAKLAGLLVDEHDVGPGARVGVRLPLHWETAVVLLGVWVTGAAVLIDADDAAVTFATPGGAPVRGARVDLTPTALGIELSRLVAAQPDTFVPLEPVDPQAAALVVVERTWTHEELASAARAAAQAHGLDRSARVLSTLALDTVDGLDAGLLAPLAAGGSAVLVAHADVGSLSDRCRVEQVTHTAGADVPGLPRLDG